MMPKLVGKSLLLQLLWINVAQNISLTLICNTVSQVKSTLNAHLQYIHNTHAQVYMIFYNLLLK